MNTLVETPTAIFRALQPDATPAPARRERATPEHIGSDSDERALSQLRHRHKLILNAAGEGIYGLDREGKGTFANPAAIRMLGWTPAEVIGRKVHDLHHHSRNDGSHYPHRDCPIYAAIRDGKVHSCDDEVFWHKNGTKIPVEYTSTPIREGDTITGAVVIFRDISDRKVAEAALRRLQESERLAAVGEFSASIAHEIRSPLSTISMALDYLDAAGQSDKAKLRLDLAIAEVKRLERLLGEILLFAKPQQLNRAEIDPDALITHTLVDLQSAPPEQRPRISYSPPPRPLRVLGDQDKLKQVVINLLSNACQATPPTDNIAIRVKDEPATDTVVIEVVNPGTIAQHALERATEPFFTTKSSGTGLGLAIVKRIVEAHRGELSILSDERSGVTARVSLRAMPEPA